MTDFDFIATYMQKNLDLAKRVVRCQRGGLELFPIFLTD